MVKVSGGVVTLTGTVEDRNAKRMAEDVAESISGVQEVQNQLRVSPGGNGGSNKQNESSSQMTSSSSSKG